MKPTKGNWTPGNNGHCIITDSEEELSHDKNAKGTIAYYGGAVIAETVSNQNLHILCASKELYAALTEAIILFKEKGIEIPESFQCAIDKAHGKVTLCNELAMDEKFIEEVKSSIEEGVIIEQDGTKHYTNMGGFIGTTPLSKEWPESTSVVKTTLIESENILEVEFKNGKKYHYESFPDILWSDLLKTKSIGQFINKQVKGQFTEKEIK